jgi:hypothetical protein
MVSFSLAVSPSPTLIRVSDVHPTALEMDEKQHVVANPCRDGPVQCRERLGGLLRYYHQEAA